VVFLFGEAVVIVRHAAFVFLPVSAMRLRGAGVCAFFRWYPRGGVSWASFGVVCWAVRWHPRCGVCRSSVAPVRLPFRWHPRYAFVLQASPLCGAAPTFLCRRKEK
jgi:hypothetical protein